MKEFSLSVISFLNKPGLICLQTSIAIFSILLNGFNYFYLTLIIQFNINHLFLTMKRLNVLTFKLFNITHLFACPVSWGCKIH